MLTSIGIIYEGSRLKDTILIGELSLEGRVEPVNGVLPMCIEALRFGIRRVIVPKKNEKEAACVSGIEVIGVSDLKELVNYLNGKMQVEPIPTSSYGARKNGTLYSIDYSEVKGQAGTKRALEIAVARKS